MNATEELKQAAKDALTLLKDKGSSGQIVKRLERAIKQVERKGA